MDNLNSSMEIKHALERKLGYGAMTRIAELAKVTPSAVTLAIKKRGKAATSPILAVIAAELGQPVYGIEPVADSTKTN